MSINLVKGQKINLEKADGSSFTKVMMGLGWDPVKNGWFGLGGQSSIDLDASVLMLGENKQVIDTVSFQQLRSHDGSIIHSGDNLTGDGDGDDETISVDLSQIPANVSKLIFTINSYRGQTFDKVDNCFARLVDKTNNKEIFKYTLSDRGNHTGKIMCSVYRHNGGWKAAAIGSPANASTIGGMLPDILAVI